MERVGLGRHVVKIVTATAVRCDYRIELSRPGPRLEEMVLRMNYSEHLRCHAACSTRNSMPSVCGSTSSGMECIAEGMNEE
jgi:hypothetical protein